MDTPQLEQTVQKGIRAARRGHHEPARRLLRQVVEADPDNEVAWLWLAKVADPDDPDQKTDILQRVLTLNPENKWAAGQLAELQGDTSEAAEPERGIPEDQFGEISLELLNCPNCGSTLDIHGEFVKTVICPSCGSTVDLSDKVPALAAGPNKRKFHPSQPINPGDEGVFGGKKHQVIGWLRYKGWDDEETWYWTEWLLVSEDGDIRWLSHDNEAGFTFFRPLPITQKFDLRTGFPVEGARVTERATAAIKAIQGEMTWKAKVGDRINYIDAQKDGRQYSVEYTQDEVELTEGVPLTEEQIWTAFGRQELLEKIKKARAQHKFYSRLRNVCYTFTVLAVLFICYSLVAGGQIFEETVTVNDNNPRQVMGPFEIVQAGRPHEVEMNISGLPVNNWAVLAITMRDSAENEYYLFAEEFWDEDGYDSDGYWHESDTNGSYIFRPEDAGNYTLIAELDDATVNNVTVTVTVYQGIWLTRYFLIFGILAFILALVLNLLADIRRP